MGDMAVYFFGELDEMGLARVRRAGLLAVKLNQSILPACTLFR